MMKEWTPSSAGFGSSIQRDHSPYCEARGPIIQEGFVAQRIRALQDLQAHALAGNRSHSPMIPCPPRWVRSYDALSPPRHMPLVKIPAMSEYGTVKHHWASKARESRNDIARGNSSAGSEKQVRSSHNSPRGVRPDERRSDSIETTPSIDSGTGKSPGDEYIKGYKPYVGPSEASCSNAATIVKQVQCRERQPGEQSATPANVTANTCSIDKNPSDWHEQSQQSLHSEPANTVQDTESTTNVSRSGHEIEANEPQSAITRSLQSVGLTVEQAADCQSIEPDEPSATFRRSSQSKVSAVGGLSRSETTELDESPNPIYRTIKDPDDGVKMSPSKYTPTLSERIVLGPNPVPADLADLAVLSHCISPERFRDNGHDDMYGQNHDRTSQQARKSVADKLGSLVERGWIGCDVFGRTYDQVPNFESVPTTTKVDDDRADSRSDSTEQKLPLFELLSEDAHSLGSSINDGSGRHEIYNHDTSQMDKATSRRLLPLNTAQSEQLKERRTHGRSQSLSIEIFGSDNGSLKAKSSISSPTSKRRVFSLQHLHRPGRSNTESIELKHLLQDSSMNEMQDYVPAKLLSQEEASSTPNPERSTSRLEQEQKASVPAFAEPTFRHSSVPRNEYVRSSSRSTSWFKRSWLKNLLGDRQPMLEGNSSKEHSTTDGAHKELPTCSKQPSRDIGNTSTLTGPDPSSEAENATASAVPKSVPVISKSQEKGSVATFTDDNLISSRNDEEIGDHVRSLSESPPVSILEAVDHEILIEPLRRYSHKHAESSSAQSKTPLTSRPITVPSRQSLRGAAVTSSRSAKSASELSGDDLHSPTSSTSVSVQIHKISRLSPVPLDHANGRPGPRSAAEQPKQQRPEAENARGRLGRGNSIRKIQVIISFDGTEDVVIETAAPWNTSQRG